MDRDSVDSGVLRRLWRAVASRYSSYDLVLPGENSFICRAATCNAWCCRALSVPVGDADAEWMQRASGLPPAQFLECENGEPIALPLAEPYLLARREGACSLLGKDLLCSRYEGRPVACRLYPYQPAWLDVETGKPMSRGAVGAIALVLRHRECPGFTGPPLGEEEWVELVASLQRLQSGESQGSDWPERQA